jgi:ABC-type xylose transport system permease subunit
MSDKELTGEIGEEIPSQAGLRWAGVGSFLFILLQSACTAVMAISGFRLLIGLSALAAASGVYGPAKGFHQDAIRIPMMVLALVGALANLYSVWRVRSLRARPAAQWRVQPLSRKKLLSEWVQVVLAILTLILIAVEWITHSMIHRF